MVGSRAGLLWFRDLAEAENLSQVGRDKSEASPRIKSISANPPEAAV